MVMIFLFSSQPGEESSAESSRIVNLVLNVLEYVRGTSFSSEEMIALAEKIHTPIRKLAHMTEYALLAISILFPDMWQKRESLYDVMGGENKNRGKTWNRTVCAKIVCRSMFLVVLYASTDEFHQLFVAGRSGSVQDVLIDSCGGILGIAAFLFIWKLLDILAWSKKIKRDILYHKFPV